MSTAQRTVADLLRENEELQRRLEEAEDTIYAIRGGEVDAFVIGRGPGPEILTLGTSDRPYRLLIDKMEQGAVTLAGSGAVLYASRRLAEMLAVPLEKLIGSSLRDFVSDADWLTFEALVRQARQGSTHAEVTLRRGDGGQLPVYIAANALLHEAGGVCLIVTDLSEQRNRESESALRRSELQFRSILEKLPAAAYTCDRDGLITYFNQRAVELWGRAPKLNDHVDRFCGSFKLFAVDGSPIAHDQCWMALALKLCKEYNAQEIVIERPDGQRVTVLAHANPIRNESGKLLGAVNVLIDITERRQAAEAQGRLAAIVESSEDAIVSKTLEGVITSWNTGAERIFGYSAEEAIGQSITLIIPPDRQDEERLILDRVGRGERIGHYETIRMSKHGRLLDISLTVSPIRDHTGRIVGASKVARDITDRKRAEQALRESEARFRLMANTTPSIIWTAAPDGTITFSSDRWFEYTGISPEQNARDWPVVLHPDDAQRCLRTWQTALRDGTEYEIEVRNRRHDGAYRWFITRATPIRAETGEITCWFGSTTDIHDHKQMEHTLRKQNERLRLLSEAAGQLLAAGDPDLMVRGLFEQVRDQLGVDTYLNFMVNETNAALTLVSCAGIPEEIVRTMTRLEFGQSICGTAALERRAITATHIQLSDDPKAQWIRSLGIRAYTCNPLLVGQRLLGTLSFGSRTRDWFEDNELEFLRTICHHVAVAHERVRLISQLREADRRKDEFLGMLAHELRNPLAVISNATEVLDHIASQEPQVGKLLAMCKRQTQNLTRMIDDLLDVSRITRGKIRLKKEVTELSNIVARAVETARPVIESRRHDLVVSLGAQPMWLEADVTRLEQVLVNLLNNAAKYTEPGGQIRLSAEQEKDHVVVRVEDNGVGIPPEMLRRVFDPFTQVDSSLAKSQGGLGIGLALVRSLVELHQGVVTAHSDGQGRGSRFLVRLPALGEVQRDLPAPSIAHTASAQNQLRVLVVDDHVEVAESICILLGAVGHDARAAHNGAGAIEAAIRGRPEVILIDIGMPEMDGFELACRLRAEPGLAGVYLVALTGYGRDDDRRRATESGFDSYLVKPIDLATLEAVMSQAIEAHTAAGSPISSSLSSS